MDVKLIYLSSRNHKWYCWALDFTVKINEALISGKAFNYSKPGIYGIRSYGIKLKFDNPEIIKDPKYKEIRTKILEFIATDKSTHEFCALTVLDQARKSS